MDEKNLKDLPIGVFDSGVGGLTVVREIMRQIPKERIVYFSHFHSDLFCFVSFTVHIQGFLFHKCGEENFKAESRGYFRS